KALREYFEKYKEELCDTCLSRLEKNPMRILDCKSPICSKIAKDAPKIIDFLCDECKEHFEKVKDYLEEAGVQYKVNPTIVRGLDYYTKTVFEFVSDNIGAQGTVCGGGRYDGLIEQLGGGHTPSLGFAMGIERLLLLLEKTGVTLQKGEKTDLYVATIGEKAHKKGFALANVARTLGIVVQTDVAGKGLRPQMKYADKIGAKFTMVLGDDEVQKGKAEIKNMKTGEKTEISLLEDFVSDLTKILVYNG
ncbi:MAG: histidine--tRNA ligase, partial [Acutalibacteraceae bacterium]